MWLYVSYSTIPQIFKKTDEDYFLFAEQVKSENKIKRVVDISIIEARHLVAKDIEGI